MYTSRDRIEYVDWSDIDIFVDELMSWSKEENYNFDGVCHSTPDGAVIAKILSDELHIPQLRYPTLDSVVVDLGVYPNQELVQFYNAGYIVCTLYHGDYLKFEPYFTKFKNTRINTIRLPWDE